MPRDSLPVEGAPRSARSTRARPSDDELLDGACAVFARHGFRATTMGLVAEHCDSTKPTLYAHFASKEALYARLLEREAERCRLHLFAVYDDSASLELAEQVSRDTRAVFDYAAEHPDGFSLLFGGDVNLTAVQVRERLLGEVTDQIAGRVHDYLARDAGRPTGGAPDGIESQLAVMLASVALSAARHVLADGADPDSACALATAFSVAALRNL